MMSCRFAAFVGLVFLSCETQGVLITKREAPVEVPKPARPSKPVADILRNRNEKSRVTSGPASSCDPKSGWCKGKLDAKYDVDSHPLKGTYDETENQVAEYRKHEYEFEDGK